MTAPTVDNIHRAVTDPDIRATNPEAIAEAIGTGDVDTVRALISSMRVSGYLIKQRNGDLEAGPTRLPAAPAGRPPSRPAATATTAPGQPLPDKLRMAARVHLEPGQALAGSESVNDGDGGFACVAAVSGRYGPTVRLGVPIYAEDKRNWRGADRGSTVVLDAAGVDQLRAEIERVIAEGKASQAYAKALWDRAAAAFTRMEQLQRARYATVADAEAKMLADAKARQEEHTQTSRLAGTEPAVRNLDPALRAQYDQLERQWQQTSDRERQWAIREQQGMLVTGLTLDELRELYDLDTDYDKRRAHKTRYEALLARPSNVTGRRARAQKDEWLDMIRIHHGTQDEVIGYWAEADALEAQARPLSVDERRELDEAIAERLALQDELDSILGHPVVTAEIPGEWGALVVQCVPDEDDLTLSYRAAVRPNSADPESWTPDDNGDPWTPKPAQLRRLAATVAALRDAAVTPGDRRPPAGVVPFAV